MNYSNDNDMWDWQSRDYSLEDDNTIGISDCLLNGGGSKDDNHLFMCDELTTTPIKACGDLAYHAPSDGFSGKDLGLDDEPEPSSQVKRRRMLQFEPEVLNASTLCTDDAFLRSKETRESLGDTMAEMSQWVAGFAGDDSGATNECLDPSAEGWIADCFSDAELNFSNEDLSSTSGASDIQIDIADFCNAPEYDVNSMEKQPTISTRSNVIFKGRKSYMRTPPKLASSVVRPFAFIKPCGAKGDVTLNDINRRIRTPPKPIQIAQPSVTYPKSAFSGKPVVGKTKIHTEGGKGSITIMRTKG